MEQLPHTTSHTDSPGRLTQQLLGYFEERLLKLVPEFPHLTAWGGIENSPRIPKIPAKKRIGKEIGTIWWLTTGDFTIEEAQRLGFRGTFDPVEALEKVKIGTSVERRQKLAEWKQEYQSLLETIATLPDTIEKIVKDLPIDNWMDGLAGAVITICNQKGMSIHPRIGSIICTQWVSYCKKRQETYKLYEKYKDNPKDFIILNEPSLQVDKIQGKVEIKWDDPMIIIKIHNPKDFGYVLDGVRTISLTSGFVRNNDSSVMYIKGAMNNIESILGKGTTQIHEGQHIKNRFMMTDLGCKHKDYLIRIKDEIIAFLAEDTYTSKKLKNILCQNYSYYTTDQGLSSSQKAQIAPLFRDEVNRAVNIAIRFRAARIPNYLTLLAITPVRQWSQLEDLYFHSDPN